MLKKYFILLTYFFVSKLTIAQQKEIQIGVQTGIAIPMGQFASGYDSYLDNGYATTGYNYKVYADIRLTGALCLGINYMNFTNGLEEGNLYAAFNNIFTTINPKVIKKYETNALIGSLMLKGKETPLFIKAYGGFGRSKSAEVNGSNTFGSLTFMQTTSNISLIYGIGAGIYVPIKEKYFIEIEGSYLVSNGKPSDTKAINENTKEEFLVGDITYNPTVINLNIGIGIFLFRE